MTSHSAASETLLGMRWAGPRHVEHMQLSIKRLILISFMVVLIPALVLLSIADYRKANKALQDNFDFMVEQTAQNVTGAYSLVEVGY